MITLFDLSKLVRFGWGESYIGDSSELIEDPNGTFVRYEDVVFLLQSKSNLSKYVDTWVGTEREGQGQLGVPLHEQVQRWKKE